jgi:hypothetical protein
MIAMSYHHPVSSFGIDVVTHMMFMKSIYMRWLYVVWCGIDKMLELLNPSNCVVIFIDHQPAMTFGVASIDRQTLINNCVGLAKSAATFKVPVILTSVETKSFSGNFWPQLTEIFPGQHVIERTSMNSWDSTEFVDAIKKTGRKKLVIAALWTEVCLLFPALCAAGNFTHTYTPRPTPTYTVHPTRHTLHNNSILMTCHTHHFESMVYCI